MTREKRYKHYCLPEHVSQMDKIEKTIWEVIEDCHDDFESRTCKNCMYDNCNYKECKVGVGRQMYERYDNKDDETYLCVDKTFGCNKFKRKEDEV